jgi:5-carboxymethyl-2-hydroxymuconate isomerase
MSDQDPWTPFSTLGTDVTTTAEAIALAETMRERLGAGAPGTLASDAATACPVVAPTKMLAVGLNYLDHIRETGAKRPERPVIFAKYPSALTGPRDPILHDPRLTDELDYEAELAVVIGRRARRLTHQNALDAVFGYTVANDVSARDVQFSESQWVRGKSFDTFCPLGPAVVTRDEIADPQSLALRTLVNGETMQDSTTAEMLFGVAELLAFCSANFTLEPGDLVLTGTPWGCGHIMDPPRHLAVGDVVECTIDGIGTLRNRVVAA